MHSFSKNLKIQPEISKLRVRKSAKQKATRFRFREKFLLFLRRFLLDFVIIIVPAVNFNSVHQIQYNFNDVNTHSRRGA